MADSSILRYLEELKKNNKRSKRRPPSLIRISDGMDHNINSAPIRVEVKPAGDSKDVDGRWLRGRERERESNVCNTIIYS